MKLLCKIFGHKWKHRIEYIMYGVADFHSICKRCGCHNMFTERSKNVYEADFIERIIKQRSENE